MSDVVQFPKPKEQIWVCGCGCSTFELVGNGMPRCALCETPVTEYDGAWFSEVENGPERSEDEDRPVKDIQGNRSIEFARRRLQEIATDPDAALLVVARKCGAVSTWSIANCEEQVSWVKSKLDTALELITRNIRGGDND